MGQFFKRNIFMLLATALSLVVLLDQSIPVKKIDPEIKPLYKEFISYVPKSCRGKLLDYNKVIIEFDTLGSSFIGICRETIRERRILLDKWFWRWSDRENQRQLLFHEMAHCFLEKDHVDDIGNYMFPVHFPVAHDVFLQQVKSDIKEFCENES